MAIKMRNVLKKSIKVINKGIKVANHTREDVMALKEKSENSYSYGDRVNDNGSQKINENAKMAASRTVKHINRQGFKSTIKTKENLSNLKIKIKDTKNILSEKNNIKKYTPKVNLKGKKPIKKQINNSIKEMRRNEKSMKKASKKAVDVVKKVASASSKAIKATIMALQSLIHLLIAGGWVVVVVIIVICLIAALCSSFLGIFFSGENTSPNAITMKDVIAECNKEFSNKLQNIQDNNPHDEYVLDGTMATWKDVLIVYTVKISNGTNEQEVVTIDNNKKQILKDIFWDMNEISSKVKDEMVTERGTNTDELPTEVQKKVLHIIITSKTAEQMIEQYNFNPLQLKQYNELIQDDYSMLWNGVVYGLDAGEYINWRQRDASWSNVRIGNTTSTIGDIGCLVTSIAVLIQKSGVSTNDITPFNPGTFVEALNRVNGFSSNGSLIYAPISKVIPNFKYIGKVELSGKTREEKLSLITNYFNKGYYLTTEVKGATPGNQHWVAVIGINGNEIIMVDPGTNQTNMWNAYEWSKTSQFNYFQAN